MNSIDVLASIIREVDGNHTLGAGALAEAIHAHPRAQEAFADPRPIEVRALSALDRLEAQLCRTDPHAHIDLILIRRVLVRLMLPPEAEADAATPEVVVFPWKGRWSSEEKADGDVAQKKTSETAGARGFSRPWFEDNTAAAPKVRMQEPPAPEASAPQAAAPAAVSIHVKANALDPAQPPHPSDIRFRGLI